MKLLVLNKRLFYEILFEKENLTFKLTHTNKVHTVNEREREREKNTHHPNASEYNERQMPIKQRHFKESKKNKSFLTPSAMARSR